MVLDNVPNDVIIDSRIPMNDEVTETDDLLPLDIGILLAFSKWDLRCGFAYHNQATKDRVEWHPMALELIKRQPRAILKNNVACFDNILNEVSNPMRHGASPARWMAVGVDVLPLTSRDLPAD